MEPESATEQPGFSYSTWGRDQKPTDEAQLREIKIFKAAFSLPSDSQHEKDAYIVLGVALNHGLSQRQQGCGLVEEWRQLNNEVWPHSNLGEMTSKAYARMIGNNLNQWATHKI